jgi:hypothetical protein
MYVQLIVNGVIKASWYYDHSQFMEPYCEAGIEEKERMWNKVRLECEEKAGGWMNGNCELYFNIPAKVQPKHISDEEYREFEEMLEEKQNKHIAKIKRRFEYEKR